jgi:hypothetical protein
VDRIGAADQALKVQQVAQVQPIQLLVHPLPMPLVQQATIHHPQPAVQIQAMAVKEQSPMAGHTYKAQLVDRALL